MFGLCRELRLGVALLVEVDQGTPGLGFRVSESQDLWESSALQFFRV